MTRDNQKGRVYEAENTTAYKLTGKGKYEQTIPNADLQAWVDAALRRKAIRSRWPNDSIEVVLKRGGSAYGYRFGGNGDYMHRITLPAFARNPWVVIHEMAHVLNSTRGTAPHGPEFAGLNLWLVRTIMGAEAGKEMLAVYRSKPRVRHNLDALPEPMRVPTLAEQAAKKRARETRPLQTYQQREVAALIRRAVAAGQFGPSGRKPREHALATARRLEQS